LNTHDNEQHNLSTAHLQISHADVLLVNKVDLVPETARIAVLERIRSINALARVYETEYAQINGLDAILDLHAYDQANLPVDDFNRDSSGHLDHVSSLHTLMKAYINSLIPTANIVSHSTRETR
jgi:G3E family GTPase